MFKPATAPEASVEFSKRTISADQFCVLIAFLQSRNGAYWLRVPKVIRFQEPIMNYVLILAVASVAAVVSLRLLGFA